jgi:hypothetical protein
MHFLLQLTAKMDSPLIPHHFFSQFFFQFSFNSLDLVLVANDSQPLLLSRILRIRSDFGKTERGDRVDQKLSTNLYIKKIRPEDLMERIGSGILAQDYLEVEDDN